MNLNPYLGIERHRLSNRRLKEAARAEALREEEARAAEEARRFLAARSGLTPEEWDARELELRERERERRELERDAAAQKQREFAGRFMPKGARLPDAQAVVNALTEAHAGGPPVSLAALLVESGSAPDLASAVTQTKQRHGREVVELLRALSWTQTRRSAGILWVPPEPVH